MTGLGDGRIEQFIRRRVCSRCYGDLEAQLISLPGEQHLYEPVCPDCGDAWGGTTISRATAERRGQVALTENREVKANLPDLFPNPNTGKTPEQILSELGF